MSSQLDEIVRITITRQTSVPSMASFSEHLIVDMFDNEGITPIFDAAHRVRIYIDVIHGVDWLRARLQNLVFTPLVQLDKVPITDAGIQSLVDCVKAGLDEGVMYQIINSDYEVTAPTREEIPQDNKAEMTLPNVKFTASLQGAFHRVIIDGTVTL